MFSYISYGPGRRVGSRGYGCLQLACLSVEFQWNCMATMAETQREARHGVSCARVLKHIHAPLSQPGSRFRDAVPCARCRPAGPRRLEQRTEALRPWAWGWGWGLGPGCSWPAPHSCSCEGSQCRRVAASQCRSVAVARAPAPSPPLLAGTGAAGSEPTDALAVASATHRPATTQARCAPRPADDQLPARRRQRPLHCCSTRARRRACDSLYRRPWCCALPSSARFVCLPTSSSSSQPKRRDQGASPHPLAHPPPRAQPGSSRRITPIAPVLLRAGLNPPTAASSAAWLTPSGRNINILSRCPPTSPLPATRPPPAQFVCVLRPQLASRMPSARRLHPDADRRDTAPSAPAPREHGLHVQHQRERRPRDAVHQAELHRRRQLRQGV